MNTRPLDLASKLRPEPRSFDGLFFVNVGLIVLFFSLAGSRFVLAPGVGMDFELPRIHGAGAGAAETSYQITVERSGLIIIDDGPADLARLREWLKEQAKTPGLHRLLVTADVHVSNGQLTAIYGAAHDAGFEVQVAAQEARTVPGEP